MTETGKRGPVNWWEVVLNLRQDQQLIVSKWKEVHKCSQQLNEACDLIFRSLWVNHALGLALTQVLTHRLQPADWVTALDNSFAVSFVDGYQALEYNVMESYSRFLGCLQSNPAVTSEIVVWVGNEGLGTPELVSDLMSVVYGECLFQEDHVKFLEFIICLLSHHIDQCHTYKDLFVFEHECSRAITEYCRYLPGLREFLVCTLQEPLTHISTYNKRYLEFDVSKASTRLQEGNFDVQSHIEMSCKDLSEFCTIVVKNLEIHKKRFPASLQWITAKLKILIKKKWPGISATEASRPISDLFFRYVISAAFTSPDLLGILDPSIVLNEMSSYNLSQVFGVLQGCAWIMNRSTSTSSEYPMKRVIKLMKLKRLVSLIDWLQVMPVGYTADIPPIQPLLPGLRKSFFMASKHQLEDIVAVSREASNSFKEIEDPNQTQREVNQAVALAPNLMFERDTRNPYSFSVNKSLSSDFLLSNSPECGGKKNKSKQRSRSTWGSKADKISLSVPPQEISKSSTLCISNIPKSSSASCTNSLRHNLTNSTTFDRFAMPHEVLLIPVWQSDRNGQQQQQQSGLWEFELLSEEEFLHNKNQPSPLKSLPSSIKPAATNQHPTPTLSLDSPVLPLSSIEPHSLEQSQESYCCLPNNNNNNGDNSSIKSWSPETYNGSISAEEDEAEYKLVQANLSKSSDYSNISSTDTLLKEDLASSSYTVNHEVRKKSFSAWISRKIKKKQKLEVPLDTSIPEKEVHRVGSYKRVGHITAKYEKISREKRKLEALEDKGVREYPSSDSPLLNNIPSSVDEFISLPLYAQMKYKLAIILSNIHIPTPSFSSTKTTNSSKALVMLLEESLYRNKWIADSSESGVIRELLSRLNELDENCIRALYYGVVQNQTARQKYLHYLTNSRLKFTDIHLELGSVQQLIDRSRQLEETAFLNFSVQSFLRFNNERLKQLESELELCETGDEICAIVQKRVEEFSRILEMESMWNVWPEEDLSRVNECLTNHLFSHFYKQTFMPNGDSDLQRDQVFSDLLKELSSTVTPNHHLLKIQKVYLSTCPWPEVQSELLLMTAYKSPRGKLKCIIRACQLLIRSLQLSKCGDPPGADDTFPALVYILIKSNPPSLLSTEQYIKTFCDPVLTGEDAYWWTQFQSAISFLRTPAFTHS